ncbi:MULTISPECIES: MFS transporter [Pseudonocardia]|uniref:Antiseptic resistance protein n=2 Tax=Pseudonocardia TaxID=1847 RepID=A0A1Y2N9E9_PSEAH|nr:MULTISPECIES: MFS transporter [Pseudonocardia]OSY44100.1 Antiseptic resistance protein [Pseudonocardia autotrophica]TDN74170.1 DHA2 family multidrug resistance protein-like MFS transporter [Pseudonocardia autotrophica]BBG04930.1 MFS transporter [Pseudonocardia autotrophica]GEC23586.1 MFS transporter [Pseudonocardia saturnea]
MTTETPLTSGDRAGPREWIGLAVLALPLLVLALDISVLYLAAPALAVDLQPSATQQLWILDIYGFLIAGFLITMGTLGDRIGRRRLLLIGAAAFAVASVLAAFAPTAELLIAARALLGIAGATLMPSTLGLISTMFPDPVQRRFAVAVWMTTFSVGAAIGPLVGGALVDVFWWGAVFLIGVPVMLLLLVLGPLLLPEEHGSRAGRLDPTSVVLSLTAMLPLVYTVKNTAAYGPEAITLVPAAVGLLSGVLFVRRQRRLTDPLLDVALFTRPVFTAAVLVLLVALLAVNGLFFVLPQYLQLVGGASALTAGLWMLPLAGVTVVGSLLTPVLARRFGVRTVVAAAAGLAAIGSLLVGLVGAGGGTVAVIVLVSGTVLGLSPIGVLATDLVIGSVPAARAGSAASISETAGELGVALGVAVTGSVLAAVYTGRLVLPPGLPGEAAERSREGLAGAVTAAESLPPGLGTALLDAGRSAFTAGFGVVGLVASGLMAGVVLLALTALRHADR